jgi:ribosomal 30S subunit maturation factor RimM
MKKKTKHTLLKGEGANQHTLYGDFKIEEVTDFPSLVVTKESLLKHEQPDGSFSNEHQTLKIESGNWSMGKQVEYNPFEGRITQIWD